MQISSYTRTGNKNDDNLINIFDDDKDEFEDKKDSKDDKNEKCGDISVSDSNYSCNEFIDRKRKLKETNKLNNNNNYKNKILKECNLSILDDAVKKYGLKKVLNYLNNSEKIEDLGLKNIIFVYYTYIVLHMFIK